MGVEGKERSRKVTESFQGGTKSLCREGERKSSYRRKEGKKEAIRVFSISRRERLPQQKRKRSAYLVNGDTSGMPFRTKRGREVRLGGGCAA